MLVRKKVWLNENVIKFLFMWKDVKFKMKKKKKEIEGVREKCYALV